MKRRGGEVGRNREERREIKGKSEGERKGRKEAESAGRKNRKEGRRRQEKEERARGYLHKWAQTVSLYELLFSKSKSENVKMLVVSDSLQPHGLWPTRLLCPWDSPGKKPGVGSHFLLQGIFLIQGLNVDLPHCRQFLYHLSHQGNPKSTSIKQ